MSVQTISRAIRDKGQRLFDENRVRRLTGNVYEVQGDSDSYIAWVADAEQGQGGCNCPAGREKIFCSHLYATAVYERTNPPPPLTNLSPAGRDLSDPFDIFD